MLGKGIAVLGMWGFLGFCAHIASQSNNPELGQTAVGWILIAFGSFLGMLVTATLVAKKQ